MKGAIVSSSTLNIEIKKDLKQEMVEKNPCPKCRTQGYPICMGHGGGGTGGSSSDASEESPSESKDFSMILSQAPNSKTPMDICSLLGLNEDWVRKEDLDAVFTFDNCDALFTMELDMEHGKLSIFGKRGLTYDQYALLGRYLTRIENELNEFKKELLQKGFSPDLIDKITMTREGNVLTIKFPAPGIYDAFVQRLVDKNLLPAKAAPAHDGTKTPDLAGKPSPLCSRDSEIPYKSTAPTPFNAISKGLRPEGFE